MVVHDFICLKCDTVILNSRYDGRKLTHGGCGGEFVILWTSRVKRPAALPLSESTCVLYSPIEKQYQYPGQSMRPIPGYLKRRGYEKVWLRSDADVGRFEKEHHVVNERRHFNNGNG